MHDVMVCTLFCCFTCVNTQFVRSMILDSRFPVTRAHLGVASVFEMVKSPQNSLFHIFLVFFTISSRISYFSSQAPASKDKNVLEGEDCWSMLCVYRVRGPCPFWLHTLKLPYSRQSPWPYQLREPQALYLNPG